ncbi:hypothetical protein C8R45DRAFT_941947 [Mycena sanguinolenta]|nr:hypothetical protein C8R45DRAFT_941947 [Mycena sanguinolenta]
MKSNSQTLLQQPRYIDGELELTWRTLRGPDRRQCRPSAITLSAISLISVVLLLSIVEEVEVSVLTAGVSAQLGSYFGYEASVSLITAKAGAFSGQSGYGTGYGIGLGDEFVEVELIGCGFTIGKRLRISVFETKIEINFGAFF